MNLKEALKQDAQYFRGLGHLDKQLRQKWINRNKSQLEHARGMLNAADYKTFAENLYLLQMWNGLEEENIKNGVYGKNYKPTVAYVQQYFAKKVADIDNTLKYHPDLDENNAYVGPDKNTGFSPEVWNIYNGLKDEKAKEEFRSQVSTEDVLKKKAEDMTYANQIAEMSSSSPEAAQGMAIHRLLNTVFKPEDSKNDPTHRDYYTGKAGVAELDKVTAANTEKAQNIYSKSLSRYRNSSEYQKSYNSALQDIVKTWNNENTVDPQNADKKHEELFLQEVKANPVLAAASGYDSSTNKFSYEQFQQYESLLNEDPTFKAKYLAHKETLLSQLKEGKISESDYKQSLIDIAKDSLKDHESYYTRARNTIKGASNTGLTYSLHKFAPAVSYAEIASKQTDGKVFVDGKGNIYEDIDVSLNAHYTNPNDAESAVLYKTTDGSSINYNTDGDKLISIGKQLYIYQEDNGSYTHTNPALISPQDPHLKQVQAIPIKNTKVDNLDLIRLGKDDTGKDLNWAGGAFNEKYLNLSELYNVSPWQKEELDHYNKYGYSKYVNIIRPGDSGKDLLAESFKMMGYIGADLVFNAITRGAGKFVGMGAKTAGLTTGLVSAGGMADAEAQGVFYESLNSNQQALQDHIGKTVKQQAETWANTEEGKAAIKDQYKKIINSNKEVGPLSQSAKAQIEASVRSQLVSQKADELYQEAIQSPDVLKMQEKAIGDAGTAAMANFWTHGLKQGIINTLGYKQWLFKGRGATESAARASEKTLFGKAFSRVGTATAEDVAAGKAAKVGDVFLKKAWADMSKREKAFAVLSITGKQMGGEAFDEWSDELQNMAAKAQNNSAFDAHLANYNTSGAYLFFDALASQLHGIKDNIMNEDVLWSAAVGAVGGGLGVGVNPLGIASLATKEGRENWNTMTTGEKINTIFSNGILSNIYEQKANDAQAQKLLARANALNQSLDGNMLSMINAFGAASKIGHSETEIEKEESDVLSLFHTFQSINAFSKTNPGLAELDALQNIQMFKNTATKLSDLTALTEEEKSGYIDQILVHNPNMTREQATAELDKVSKRAVLMNTMLDRWNDLINSEEYTKASSETEEKGEHQELLEQQFILQFLNEYTLQNMREREEQIKGSSSINTIDGIFTPTAIPTMGGTVVAERAQENGELATYGNSKAALNSIQNAYKLATLSLEQRKKNLEKQNENLKFEERLHSLQTQLGEAVSESDKQTIQKQLNDLIRDKAYYEQSISNIDNAIAEYTNQQARLEALFKNASPNDERILSARDILHLDPIARMRMLDKNNLSNYSSTQQQEIKKALAELEKKNIGFTDIQNQALASSRYSQREKMLGSLSNGEAVTPSFNTRVTNMLDAAKHIVLANIDTYSKKAMEEIDTASSSTEEASALKKELFKKYSSSALRFIKNGLEEADQAIVEEILPLVEAGEQLIDIIYNDNYGLKGLSLDERKNLQAVVALNMNNATTTEDLINNLAQLAENNINPSINTLLDKLGQVYEQQHATIVETAKEKAVRIAKANKEAQEREKAAQAALASAEAAEKAESETSKNTDSTAPQNTKSEDSKLAENTTAETTDKPSVSDYQSQIDAAIEKISQAYPNVFNEEQLAGIKQIITDGITNDKKLGNDIALFINNQKLEDQFKAVGPEALNNIIKELINTIKDVQESSSPANTDPQESSPAQPVQTTPSNNEYSPDLETIEEPGAESETSIIESNNIGTEVPQYSNAPNEEIDEQEVSGEIAKTIKGNAMSPWIYEDTSAGLEESEKQDLQRGVLVRKEAQASMQNYNNWLEARGINLQSFIDEKFAEILATGTEGNPVKIRFMRINPQKAIGGNETMGNHYFLVVEDSPAIRQVYTDEDVKKYGDYITANGKQYLIVGTAGFAKDNQSQAEAYRQIFTKGNNSVLVKSNHYFGNNPEEEFYVDQEKYTHVAKIHSGFITKQLEEDEAPQMRTISELLNDPNRNPFNLTWDRLVFGYQLRNSFRVTHDGEDGDYPGPIRTDANVGNVFLYIRGANGKYTPTMLRPTRYLETKPGKLTQKIENTLRLLSSPDHAERYKGLLALFDLIVIGQKDLQGNPIGNQILIGTKDRPSLKFIVNGQTVFEAVPGKVEFQEVLDGFARLNPRISVTLRKLQDEDTFKELDEAGVLRTDIAKLGKSSGDYSIYNIDSEGKPIIIQDPTVFENSEIQSRPVGRIRIGGQYYSKMGTSYIDESGNIITDTDLINSIQLNELILTTQVDSQVRIGKEEYFIVGTAPFQNIIKRNVGTHEAIRVSNTDEILKVQQALVQETKRKEDKAREEAAAAQLAEQNRQESTADTSQPQQEPINLETSVMDLLNKKPNQPSADRVASSADSSSAQQEKPTVLTGQDINITERKSLIKNDNSENTSIFAGEKTALDILTSEQYADSAIDEITSLWPETEDMTMSEIVDFLNKQNKITTRIKDVQAWIDTLKC